MSVQQLRTDRLRTGRLVVVLAAMDTAEQEAREHLDGDDPRDVEYGVWARDRLRLIHRDRATLQRHAPNLSGLRNQLPEAEQTCLGCTFGGSSRWLPDCPERNAVIDHWTEGDS